MASARHQSSTPADQAGRPAPGGRQVEPSTGVMKALVLVDALREQRREGDDERRADLMGHHHRRH